MIAKKLEEQEEQDNENSPSIECENRLPEALQGESNKEEPGNKLSQVKAIRRRIRVETLQNNQPRQEAPKGQRLMFVTCVASLTVLALQLVSMATVSTAGATKKKVNSDFIQQMSEGIALDEAGEYYQAIRLFTKVIEAQPGSPKAFYRRGLAHYSMQQYEEAIDDFTNVLKFSPDDKDAYLWRGNSYYALKDYRRSTVDFSTLIECAPEEVTGYVNRAANYFKLNAYELARQDLDKAIQVDPTDALSYIWRGRCYSQEGNLKQACLDFETAIQYSPESAMAHFYLGASSLETKNSHKALSAFAACARIDEEAFQKLVQEELTNTTHKNSKVNQ